MINQSLKKFNIKPGSEDRALHQSWQAYKQKNRNVFNNIKNTDDALPEFFAIIKWWVDSLENKDITVEAFKQNILMDPTIRPGRRSIFYGMLGRYCSDNNICEEFIQIAFSELSLGEKPSKELIDKYSYENNNTENIFMSSTGITSCNILKEIPYIPDYTDTEKLLSFYNNIKLSCAYARIPAYIKENPEIKDVHLKYMFENYINYEFDKKQDKFTTTYLDQYYKYLQEWVAPSNDIKLNAFVKMAILLERSEELDNLKKLLQDIKTLWPEHNTTVELADSLNNIALLINILTPITCDYSTSLPELL